MVDGRELRSITLGHLVRRPRTLPRVLSPVEVDSLLGALRTERDRAIVLAMLLGGLRRCEVLGLRLRDVNPGERRLFMAPGKAAARRNRFAIRSPPCMFCGIARLRGPWLREYA